MGPGTCLPQPGVGDGLRRDWQARLRALAGTFPPARTDRFIRRAQVSWPGTTLSATSNAHVWPFTTAGSETDLRHVGTGFMLPTVQWGNEALGIRPWAAQVVKERGS